MDQGSSGASGDIVMPPEYEFGAAENEVISGLAGPMRFVGVLSVIFGCLYLIPALLALGSYMGMLALGEGIALIAIGAWLSSAAGSFRDVVITEGNDVTNLMFALRKLRSVYTLQAWLMGIACVLVALGVILAISARPHHF
jgi:hypothetical protein